MRSFFHSPVFLLAVGAMGLLVAVRDAAVRAPADHPLARLSGLWPNHPSELDARLKLATAHAAVQRQGLPKSAESMSETLLAREPLSNTPILLAGSSAQLRGDLSKAEQAYRLARQRNPRDAAARLLLADLLLRSGRTEDGLLETLALSRITRQSEGIVAAVADYSRSPQGARHLKRIFANDPGLAAQVLGILTQDPNNADLVLALAPAKAPERPWEVTLVDSFVSANKLDQAFLLSRRFWPAQRNAGEITNPTFQVSQDPSPFSWRLASGETGLAEISTGGGLAIVYYGRESAAFARQLLLLKPGQYQLKTQVESSDAPDGLFWRIGCYQGSQIAEISVWEMAAFEIPANCKGQLLELVAQPGDVARTSTVTVKRISLVGLAR